MSSNNKGMENLIPIVNKLQDAVTPLGFHFDLDLPQIAVVGGQSAGKSSVLENFVGRDFLPRGKDIVTRRPLILQLINSPEEFGEFLHIAGKFTDFSEICKEIECETDRMTGSNKGISSVPINLRIHSPNVLNLTLIDLPGITKVPIGDQPADIEHQIKSMILEFISKESCLILAVTPANSDLANSDALKLAREVDPACMRTICVVTKLDLMDEGTDAREILENKLLPMPRGYIGVVNRSQMDINGKKDISTSLLKEKIFFESHKSYQHMADQLGTPYLQKHLSQQLMIHILKTLPFLRKRCIDKKRAAEMILEKYDTMNDAEDDESLLLQILYKLSEYFEFSTTGSGSVDDMMGEELAGSKINELFNESLQEQVYDLQIDEEQAHKEIALAIRNYEGIEPGMFSMNAFKVVYKKRVVMMKEPVLSCLDAVVVELGKAINKITEKTMARYPVLRAEALKLIDLQLRKCDQKCNEQLIHQIRLQTFYINTKHPDFIKMHESPFQPTVHTSQNKLQYKGFMDQYEKKDLKVRYWWVLSSKTNLLCYKDKNERQMMANFTPYFINITYRGFAPPIFLLTTGGNSHPLQLHCDDANEFHLWKVAFEANGVLREPMVDDTNPLEKQIAAIRRCTEHYLNIITKKVLDDVPKIIMIDLIEELKNFLKFKLFSQLKKTGQIEEMMIENLADKLKRDEATKTIKVCKKVLKIMDTEQSKLY